MGAAFMGVDGVGEGMHRFVVGGVPLHGDLHLHRFALRLESDDRRVDRVLVLVEVLDVVDEAAPVAEVCSSGFQALVSSAAPVTGLAVGPISARSARSPVRRSSRRVMVRPLFRDLIPRSGAHAPR